MFVLTAGNTEKSCAMLNELKNYQIELFSDLGLNFRFINLKQFRNCSTKYKNYNPFKYDVIKEFCICQRKS